MIKYEIPFNFDLDLLNFLESYIDKEWIEFLFIPPFKGHSSNARSHVEGSCKASWTYKEPDTLEEYDFYIKEIQKRGFTPGLLFQKEEPLAIDVVKHYLDLGINTFVVNSDKLASDLKKINSKYKVIASITKTLSAQDLWEKDYTMYDKIVLHFPFNRALSKLKELPYYYKYSLLVNSYCLYNCHIAKEHWSSTQENSHSINCLKGDRKDDLIYIPPEYTKLFAPHVDSFKIQGREYPTHILGEEIYCYYKGLHNPFAGAIYNRLSPFNVDEYFNKGKDLPFVNYKPNNLPNMPTSA